MDKSEPNYRVVVYDGIYFAERLKSPGVWDVIDRCNTRGEAEIAIEKDKRDI